MIRGGGGWQAQKTKSPDFRSSDFRGWHLCIIRAILQEINRERQPEKTKDYSIVSQLYLR